MRLSRLLEEAGLQAPGVADAEITGIRLDSRKVLPGELFLALKGAKDDGSRYLGEAASRGAAAILSEGIPEPSAGWPELPGGVAPIGVADLRSKTGPLFHAWYGRPAEKLAEAVAVTGTNGKSTTVRLCASILREAGRKVIALGTVGYDVGGEMFRADLTTPGPEDFFRLLKLGVEKSCDVLVMEASSHALSQDRIHGVLFSRAIFTNLTRDHMDYHADFEDYYGAKKKLFAEYLKPGGMAILNLDSPYGARLAAELSCPKLTFSRGAFQEAGDAANTLEPAAAADVSLLACRLSLSGTEFELGYRGRSHRFRSALIGKINLENLLAASALGFSLGLERDVISRGIAQVTVPGRNQVFPLPDGAFAVVDYAHTPDALERVLASLRPLTPGRLLCLFGCGGDRDRSKRPLMGGIAAAGADRVFLTSDNPRGEDPLAILEAVLAGIPDPKTAEVIPDRREAIGAALGALEPGDCLLIAGKGHEDYQIVGREKKHFSDQEEILAWLEARRSRNGN